MIWLLLLIAWRVVTLPARVLLILVGIYIASGRGDVPGRRFF